MKTLIIKYITKGLQVDYVLNPDIKDNRISIAVNESIDNSYAIGALDKAFTLLHDNMNNEQLETFNEIKSSIVTGSFKHNALLVHYNDTDAVKIEYFN